MRCDIREAIIRSYRRYARCANTIEKHTRWRWRKIAERCVKAENKINFVARSPMCTIGSLSFSVKRRRRLGQLFVVYSWHAAERNSGGFIFCGISQRVRITLVYRTMSRVFTKKSESILLPSKISPPMLEIIPPNFFKNSLQSTSPIDLRLHIYI